MAERRPRGRRGALRDTMIAGIVISTGATLATRNVSDFDDLSTSVINPWQT
ncbi:MAG TPA: hypothetical protein VK514_03725 [Candidatus Acidoferrum sp.]|nr:hypothetical protein [Candidatus Acidoferrum sp.]